MKRPGEVEFKPAKEGLGQRIAFHLGATALAVITAYAMAIGVVIAGVLVFGSLFAIAGAMDSCSGRPRVQAEPTPAPVIDPLVPEAFFVPSPPSQVAGSFGVFQVHGNRSENASIIAFSYEEIHVIVVRSIAEIPAAHLGVAQRFIGGRSGRPIQPRDPGRLLQLGFLKENASFPSVAAVGSEGRVNRIPYVVIGDVDILCGSLVKRDRAIADFFLENDEIKTARLSSTFSGVREIHPVRLVYVVGLIRSFEGPRQLGSSFTSTNIVDLTATQKELAEFRDRCDKYRDEIRAMARMHRVTPWELFRHEGTDVTIRRTETGGTRVVPAAGEFVSHRGPDRVDPPPLQEPPHPREIPIR
jgi:hypothetical protein